MSLRNSVNPTNRSTTDIVINPSPATESTNNQHFDFQSEVPVEASPFHYQSSWSNGARDMHWDTVTFSKILKKICTLGLPMNKNNNGERESYIARMRMIRRRKRQREQNIWCFQPKAEHIGEGVWVAFERKNQIKLSEKFESGSTECDIQDRSIYNNEVTIKIMLRDGIGFIMDPEWQDNPVVYQIIVQPKMHWWQRIQSRAILRKKIKNNPLYAHV